MDIFNYIGRLEQTATGFAKVAGVSRAAIYAWTAPPEADYATTPSPRKLRDMADSLDLYAEDVKEVAEELRQAAEERA
jgi:hypothetical protein